jgi:hypothetical protein
MMRNIKEKIKIAIVLSTLPAVVLAGQAGATGTFVTILENIANFLKALGAAMCVICLILAGFYFMTAGGDEKKLALARQMILWAVVGLIILLVSRPIVDAVESVIK